VNLRGTGKSPHIFFITFIITMTNKIEIMNTIYLLKLDEINQRQPQMMILPSHILRIWHYH
jgi:hypothetical protein